MQKKTKKKNSIIMQNHKLFYTDDHQICFLRPRDT